MAEKETLSKIEQLGKAVRSRRVAILTHNNPDPDCIAAATGLSLLLKRRFRTDSKIFYGGIIGRAENRAMVRILKLPLHNVKEFDHRVFRTVALIDTQPLAGNNLLHKHIQPDIVIDHHLPIRKKTRQAAFHDIRPGVGASSTIVFGYLQAADIKIPKNIATAIFYGIKTDTYDLGREFGPDDINAYRALLDIIDRQALSDIEHPLHRPEYFIEMSHALKNIEIHEDLLATTVWRVSYPEITAEIADWLYSMRGIKWVLSIGIDKEDDIYLSVRTRERKRDAAGRLIRGIVGNHGMAGGHSRIAGGVIHLDNKNRDSVEAEVERVKARFFKALARREATPTSRLIKDADC